MSKNPLNDEQYASNDEQISDLKDLVADLFANTEKLNCALVYAVMALQAPAKSAIRETLAESQTLMAKACVE